MKWLNKIYSFFSIQKDTTDYSSIVLFPALIPEKQYRAMPADSRMRLVMSTGDLGDIKYFRFMKWCILNDPDQDVRLAALKRIPNFNRRPELDEFLLQLDKRDDRITFEPYLSFALEKSGLISKEQLESRLNS